jgi:nucleoside phosphorylase
MSGPKWFTPFSSDKPIRFVDGKPNFDRWDCCASAGLPGIHPTFREPRADETFDANDAGRIIRDGSGVVRAVAVPMKLRQGFYCGSPSESVARFESLANAVATALAGANDLQKLAFAADLADIFRKPRGGVRYIFGDVPRAPNHFVAHGWSAGVLQFEHGVLIDLPISESAPDASHWLLFLHRLGWRRVAGTGLRAKRVAWEGNVEVALETLLQDWSKYPEEFTKQFSGISKESFYSVLGTKDAPLDVNLASAFAIQLLLAELTPALAASCAKDEEAPDYSRESWKILEMPRPRIVNQDEAKSVSQPKVGILVATEVERQAVLRKLRPPRNKRAVLSVYSGKNTCFVGRLGVTDVVVCLSAMGSVGRDSSTLVTTELIESWRLAAVIMVGIAFGKDPSKQAIGNVLISDRIVNVEPERVGKTLNENRGNEPMAGAVLLNRFRNVIGWSFIAPDGRECGFQIGPLLSSEKLVDNPEFKAKQFERYPNAIGGEMEGAGVAAAADRKGCEWIVVKAICDWGDGTKTKHHQEFAAASSVSLVEHILNQPGALDALEQ